MITILASTPLWVAAQAIRTCWASEGKSDTVKYKVDFALDDIADFHLDGKILVCGPKDQELIYRVGNKYKHASTLEHLTFCASTDDNDLAQVFLENKYSVVTGTQGNWVISTNVRALQEVKLDSATRLKLIPQEYTYLFI